MHKWAVSESNNARLGNVGVRRHKSLLYRDDDVKLRLHFSFIILHVTPLELFVQDFLRWHLYLNDLVRKLTLALRSVGFVVFCILKTAKVFIPQTLLLLFVLFIKCVPVVLHWPTFFLPVTILLGMILLIKQFKYCVHILLWAVHDHPGRLPSCWVMSAVVIARTLTMYIPVRIFYASHETQVHTAGRSS